MSDSESESDNGSWLSYSDGEHEHHSTDHVHPIYIPDYECLAPEALSNLMVLSCKRIADVCNIDPERALILLQYHKWDDERATSDYYEDSKRALIHAGLQPDGTQEPCTSDDAALCKICYCEATPECPLVAPLPCLHSFCRDCWKAYLTGKIKDERLQRVNCPGEKCKLQVIRSAVQDLAGDEVAAIFDALCLESLVTYRKNLRWCPSPDCFAAIQYNRLLDVKSGVHGDASQQAQTVTCKFCDRSFCFGCGESHEPATCQMMKEFANRCEEDGGNAIWLQNNTKDCPRCGVPIEKNGGCNWVLCRSCRFEFCWFCTRYMRHADFATHRCNVYTEEVAQEGEKGTPARASPATSTPVKSTERRQDILRFRHFYERFVGHNNSLKLELNLCKPLDLLLEQLAHSIDMVDLEYLRKAWQLLILSRQRLRASYVLAYYQKWPSENSKTIFEDLQHLSESRTEALSKLLSGAVSDFFDEETGTVEMGKVNGIDAAAARRRQDELHGPLMSNSATVQNNLKNLIDCCTNLPKEIELAAKPLDGPGGSSTTSQRSAQYECPFCLSGPKFTAVSLMQHCDSTHSFEMTTLQETLLLDCPYCSTPTRHFGKHFSKSHRSDIEAQAKLLLLQQQQSENNGTRNDGGGSMGDDPGQDSKKKGSKFSMKTPGFFGFLNIVKNVVVPGATAPLPTLSQTQAQPQGQGQPAAGSGNNSLNNTNNTSSDNSNGNHTDGLAQNSTTNAGSAPIAPTDSTPMVE